MKALFPGFALAPTVALADDMPTFKLLMKDGCFFLETVEVPAGVRFRLVKTKGRGPRNSRAWS
jgi:hypothetical protein